METVTVNKAKLLKTLETNKADHQKDFEEAWDAFVEKAQHNFEQRLKQLKHIRRGEHIDLYVNLSVPEDHTDDYQRAIEMLDWEVGERVDLTEQEFQNLVQDDWSWSRSFNSAKFAYTGESTRSVLRKDKKAKKQSIPIDDPSVAATAKPKKKKRDA